MITPKEIETKQFTSTKGGGYKGDEVDQFLDEILVDYTRLLEERNALKNKVNLLTEKLNTIANTPAPAPAPVVEVAPAVAPVVINQTPSAELEEAKKKAQRLVADAEDYAKKLIETAQYEANRQNAVTKKMTEEIDAFKNSLLDTYAAHIKAVEAIPNMSFDDIEIGSETLDILNQSLNCTPADVAPVVFAETAATVDEEVFEIPTRVDNNPVIPDAALAFDSDAFDLPVKKASAAPAQGLEDLFDEEELKSKKKEKKKRKKLFFRDEDDEDDDDFFDDDDE